MLTRSFSVVGAVATALMVLATDCGDPQSTGPVGGDTGGAAGGGSSAVDMTAGATGGSGGSSGASGGSAGSAGSGVGGSGGMGFGGAGGSAGTGGGGSGGGGNGGAGGSGGSTGGAITCSTPASYNQNGGSCGTERWSVKTGTDGDASSINLVPQPTTIATLVGLPRPSSLPSNNRVAPTETTLWELKNVQLTVVKHETDSDYHLVVSDGTHTMIVEVPYPTCVDPASPFGCFITHARAAADGLTAGATVTVRGLGFFDFLHGQTGVAPNGIELHPVLAICAGQDCTPN